MAPPKLDPTISLGNVLTILVLIFGGGTAWGVMRAEVQATRALVLAEAAQAEARVADFERGAQDRELRIRTLELGAGRTDEKLLNILAALSRIETQLGDGQP